MFRMFSFTLAILFSILSVPAFANTLVPAGECALIVASRSTLSEVRNYIRTISDQRFLKVYHAENGWYAISIGTLKPHEVDPIMARWKATGKIPSDAYCSNGKKYRSIVAGFGSNTTVARQSTGGSASPMIEVMNNTPVDLLRMCLNVPLFGFNCFDVKRMDASAHVVSFDAYVASKRLELVFNKSSSDPNVFWGKMNGQPCKLQVYDRPKVKDENDQYIWLALAYRECEGSWIVAIVPKSFEARAEAYRSRLRSNAWDALNNSF